MCVCISFDNAVKVFNDVDTSDITLNWLSNSITELITAFVKFTEEIFVNDNEVGVSSTPSSSANAVRCPEGFSLERNQSLLGQPQAMWLQSFEPNARRTSVLSKDVEMIVFHDIN